jgi:hypothetical protein
MAITKPISQTGSTTNPDTDNSVNNLLKLNEMKKQELGAWKHAGNQKCRQIFNFEKESVQRVSFF